MLTHLIAQAAAPADPAGLSALVSVLQEAGPYAALIAGFVIVVRVLWARLREREARLDKQAEDFLGVIREVVPALKSLQDSVQRVEGRVSACPTRGKDKE